MTEELLKWLLAREDDVSETVQSFALDLSLSASDEQRLVRRLHEIGVNVSSCDEAEEAV